MNRRPFRTLMNGLLALLGISALAACSGGGTPEEASPAGDAVPSTTATAAPNLAGLPRIDDQRLDVGVPPTDAPAQLQGVVSGAFAEMDVQTGDRWIADVPTASNTAAAPSPATGLRMASGAIVLGWRGGEPHVEISTAAGRLVVGEAWDPFIPLGGSALYALHADGIIEIDPATGATDLLFTASGIVATALSPDRVHVALLQTDGAIRIVDLATRSELGIVETSAAAPTAIAWRNGHEIAVASTLGDETTIEVVAAGIEPTPSPDREFTAGDVGVPTERLFETLRGLPDSIASMDFDASGTYLLLVDAGGALRWAGPRHQGVLDESGWASATW